MEKNTYPWKFIDALKSLSSTVEVKGIRGTLCSFIITTNEKKRAKLDAALRLIAVTKALEAKRRRLSKAFTGPELLRKFHFASISFMATLR
jgi:hypothetical protein